MVTGQVKKKAILIVFVLVGITLPLNQSSIFCKILPYQIHQINTYSQAQKVFDLCDEKTLVTFDVDDTLITATDVIARRNSDEIPLWFKLCLAIKHIDVFQKKETREQALDRYLGTFFQQVPRFVFDKDIVRFIKQIQQQKCLTVGLTGIGSGSAGTIKSLPEWRANMLKDFGIDFSGTFNDVLFTNLPASHNNYPCLHKDILCTNFADKGAVLGAFIDYYHLKPERIMSCDDQRSALVSIAGECCKRGITFIGYQIMGAKKLPGKWNTKRALLQFETAMDKALWLSDEEADAVLAAKSHWFCA